MYPIIEAVTSAQAADKIKRLPFHGKGITCVVGLGNSARAQENLRGSLIRRGVPPTHVSTDPARPWLWVVR
jgi:hypothetical protein